TLADYAGRWLVLYFYPKDSTPGCTTEGQDFNALLPEFEAVGASVLGVSRDSVKSHRNFRDKQGFAFELVSDADEALCNAFGVIREKNMYGRKVMGIVRSTYLVDPAGRIARVWQPVEVPGHAQAALDDVTAGATQGPRPFRAPPPPRPARRPRLAAGQGARPRAGRARRPQGCRHAVTPPVPCRSATPPCGSVAVLCRAPALPSCPLPDRSSR